MLLKAGVVAFSAIAALGVSGTALWIEESAYRQPAPRPEGFHPPGLGTKVPDLAGLTGVRPGRPVFLHFMSPSCSCSKFQLDHVRWLQSRFSAAVDFVMVVEGATNAEEVRRLGFPAPVVADEGARIATAVGVHATPQAVLLDDQARIYFRGAYNNSRYGTDPETAFARIAIQSLLAGNALPTLPPSASTAFGCAVSHLHSEKRPKS